MVRKTSLRLASWSSRFATLTPAWSKARMMSASSSLPSFEPNRGALRGPGDELAEGAEQLDGAVTVRVIGGDDLDGGAPDLSLEGVRRALGDDLALIDDPEVVGELVGLLEVLGGEEERHAVVAGEMCDLVPEGGAALDVEAGGRLVEEEDTRARAAARGRGRAGASCRRSSRRPCGRPRRRGRRDRSARPRACVRSAFGIPWRAPWSRMWSRAVRLGSRAASCSAAPMASRTAAPSLTTSYPATLADPAVGGRRVVSMCTVVDLPAPLGPRKP